MHENIVDRIYEAAFVPDLWPAALEQVCSVTGSASSSLLVFSNPERPPVYKATLLTEAALRHHVTSDEWKQSRSADAVFSARGMEVFTSQFGYVADFMSEEQIARDSVKQSLRALGLDAQIGTIFPMMTGELVIPTFERRSELGRHTPEEIARLNALRPHLARASLMAARLGLERAHTSVALMQQLGLPAAVLTANRRVLAANALLEARPHVFVPRARGTLTIAWPEADALLQNALAELAGNTNAAVRSIPVPGDEGRPAMVVHVLPLRRAAHDIFSGGDVMIAATEVRLSEQGPPVNILMGLFDLTPAEARTAAALTAGKSLQTAAAEQGIQVTTARTYLDRIFRKTGTNQQSQLVSLLKSAQVPPG